MLITLEQAIEIHARALRNRLHHRAAESAREHGAALQEVGDREGQGVWLRIAEAIERFETKPGPGSGNDHAQENGRPA